MLDQLDAEGGPAAQLARHGRNHATLIQGMQAPIIVTFDETTWDFNFTRFYDRLLAEAPSFRIGCIGVIDERNIARAVACIAGIGSTRPNVKRSQP